MASNPKLVEFFLSLQDPEALRRFEADPKAAMAAAGLSDAEIAVILSGDQVAIRAILGPEDQGLKLVFTPRS